MSWIDSTLCLSVTASAPRQLVVACLPLPCCAACRLCFRPPSVSGEGSSWWWCCSPSGRGFLLHSACQHGGEGAYMVRVVTGNARKQRAMAVNFVHQHQQGSVAGAQAVALHSPGSHSSAGGSPLLSTPTLARVSCPGSTGSVHTRTTNNPTDYCCQLQGLCGCPRHI